MQGVSIRLNQYETLNEEKKWDIEYFSILLNILLD